MEHFFTPAHWQTFGLAFIISYVFMGVGVTLGYHRLLTHRALKVPKWLEYFIVAGGYLGLMGAPIIWVAVHRLHHLKSDQPGDPHSPKDGFTHALYGWMFEMPKYQSDEDVKEICHDLMNDPVYRSLGYTHKPDQASLCLTVCIVSRVILFFLFGGIALAANLLATFIFFWSTQFVNTFCHMKECGYRSFETREDSRNVWWVAILALGEGWHNNHHAMPKSARHGLSTIEVDFTWLTIWFLERIGLAKQVVRPNPTVQAAKRIGVISSHDAPLYLKPIKGLVGAELENYNESQLVGSGSLK